MPVQGINNLNTATYKFFSYQIATSEQIHATSKQKNVTSGLKPDTLPLDKTAEPL